MIPDNMVDEISKTLQVLINLSLHLTAVPQQSIS